MLPPMKKRSFRLEKITKGYDNPYVKEKIKGQDLEIMKLNDQGPVTLLKVWKTNNLFTENVLMKNTLLIYNTVQGENFYDNIS